MNTIGQLWDQLGSHHLQDFRQIVVDEWNAKHSVFFNLHSLITTGDRYIEVSLINVILELFSDDPHPIINPIIQGTEIPVTMLA